MEVVSSEETAQNQESGSPVHPPPSSSRLPPDGHEFPNYQEQDFERSYIMDHQDSDLSQKYKLAPPVPLKRLSKEDTKQPVVQSRCPAKIAPVWAKNVPERKISPGEKHSSLWKKDERSAGSVKDKIAIFSSSSDSEPVFPQNPAKPLNKFFKSSDDIFRESDKNDKSSKRNNSYKSTAQIVPSIPESAKRQWSGLSYPDRSASSVDLSVKRTEEKFATLPKKDSNENGGVEEPLSFKSRSQSMTDVAGGGGRMSHIYRTTSMIGAYSTGTQDASTDSRRLALNSLIEQRRRSMSKLKGLVIPERVVEVSPIVDLPEIKSIDAVLPASRKTYKDNQKEPVSSSIHQRSSSVSSASLSSPPWKSSNDTAMKYSPAFKRKSFQVYSYKNDAKPIDKSKTCQSPTKLTEYVETVTSPTCSDYSYDYSNSLPDMHSLSSANPIEDALKSSKAEIESDNDSAVSSSQSSYSKDFSSPPASLQDLPADKAKTDNYDSLNRRILKAKSVEAINRKNILASAKCRSGQDLNLPLIQKKDTNHILTKQNSLPSHLGVDDGTKEETNFKFSDYSDNSMHDSSGDNSLDFEMKPRNPPEPNGKSWERPEKPPAEAGIFNEAYETYKSKLSRELKPVAKTRTPPSSAPSKPSRASTAELKKTFEKMAPPPPPVPKPTPDSSNSDSSSSRNDRYKNGFNTSSTNSDFDSLNSSTTSTSQVSMFHAGAFHKNPVAAS